MAETDQKAGFCMNCRSGSHGLCMSAKCTCPDRRKHRSRPSYGSTEPEERIVMNSQPARPLAPVQTPPQPQPKQRRHAVVERVEEEPPEPDKRNLTDQILALVDGVERGVWYRVAVMSSKSAAYTLAAKLRKHEVTAQRNLEWRSSGDRIYVRGPE